MADRLNSLLKLLGDQVIDLLWPRKTGDEDSPPVFDEQPHDILPELLDTVENMLIHRMT